jgi:hypothetical protein
VIVLAAKELWFQDNTEVSDEERGLLKALAGQLRILDDWVIMKPESDHSSQACLSES